MKAVTLCVWRTEQEDEIAHRETVNSCLWISREKYRNGPYGTIREMMS